MTGEAWDDLTAVPLNRARVALREGWGVGGEQGGMAWCSVFGMMRTFSSVMESKLHPAWKLIHAFYCRPACQPIFAEHKKNGRRGEVRI